jgi:hypothetical protein
MRVVSVGVTSSGSGYNHAPRVLFLGGGGSGAQATAQVEGGSVVSVTVTDGGSGYESAPSVAFKTATGGSGARAVAAVG